MNEDVNSGMPRRPRRGGGERNRNCDFGGILVPSTQRTPPLATPYTDTQLVVTQADLLQMNELRRLSGELRRHRATILRLLEAGARIEPGQLVPVIQQSESRCLTVAVLNQLLGESVVNELRSRVQPTWRRTLLVQARDAAGEGTTGW
jgi:hypothetical protein